MLSHATYDLPQHIHSDRSRGYGVGDLVVADVPGTADGAPEDRFRETFIVGVHEDRNGFPMVDIALPGQSQADGRLDLVVTTLPAYLVHHAAAPSAATVRVAALYLVMQRIETKQVYSTDPALRLLRDRRRARLVEAHGDWVAVFMAGGRVPSADSALIQPRRPVVMRGPGRH